METVPGENEMQHETQGAENPKLKSLSRPSRSRSRRVYYERGHCRSRSRSRHRRSRRSGSRCSGSRRSGSRRSGSRRSGSRRSGSRSRSTGRRSEIRLSHDRKPYLDRHSSHGPTNSRCRRRDQLVNESCTLEHPFQRDDAALSPVLPTRKRAYDAIDPQDGVRRSTKRSAPDEIQSFEFGYDGTIGPVHWGERYRECTGKHQSPININILRVKQVSLPDIEFVGFDDDIDDVRVTNNGHTVLVQVENEPHPRVRGGPLEGDYVFSQLHFHWGDNDTYGSEDKINHRSFPMELHMVFYKEEYGSEKAAVEHSDGLTVLAFFYELDRHVHPAYDDITSALLNVSEPLTAVTMEHPFSFLNILPYDLRRYFTYRGSLTTPPCSEVVVWLDFEQPIRVASTQIEAFRELRSVHGKITRNFRPIQPIGDRTVFYNVDSGYPIDNDIDDEDITSTTKPSRRRKQGNTGHRLGIPKYFIALLVLLIVFK